jgi:hypothetical protein
MPFSKFLTLVKFKKDLKIEKYKRFYCNLKEISTKPPFLRNYLLKFALGLLTNLFIYENIL